MLQGGKGESEHVGRLSRDYVMRTTYSEAQRAMGLAKWNVNEEGISTGQRRMLEKANEILGFSPNANVTDKRRLLDSENDIFRQTEC